MRTLCMMHPTPFEASSCLLVPHSPTLVISHVHLHQRCIHSSIPYFQLGIFNALDQSVPEKKRSSRSFPNKNWCFLCVYSKNFFYVCFHACILYLSAYMHPSMSWCLLRFDTHFHIIISFFAVALLYVSW